MPVNPANRFLGALVVLLVTFGPIRVSSAQPEDFIDLGVRTQAESFSVPVRLRTGNDIRWFRIVLPATDPESGPQGFVDIWTRPTFDGYFMRYGAFGVFDRFGDRIAVGRDVSDGPVFECSFGSGDPRPPTFVPPVEIPSRENPAFFGQEGDLAAGEYWIAVGEYPWFGLNGWSAGSIRPPESLDRETDLYFNIQPGGVPYCDPDFNWDGNVDQEDAWYLINVIAGGTNETGRFADYNRDGNEDQDDVLALIHTIAGGGCP
jgi:hypothetical protein